MRRKVKAVFRCVRTLPSRFNKTGLESDKRKGSFRAENCRLDEKLTARNLFNSKQLLIVFVCCLPAWARRPRRSQSRRWPSRWPADPDRQGPPGSWALSYIQAGGQQTQTDRGHPAPGHYYIYTQLVASRPNHTGATRLLAIYSTCTFILEHNK